MSRRNIHRQATLARQEKWPVARPETPLERVAEADPAPTGEKPARKGKKRPSARKKGG